MRALLSLLVASPLFCQGTAQPFGIGCPSPGPTALGYAPNPGGGQLELFETGVVAGTVPVAVLGFSATQWNGVPLPLSLAALGLPGCSALAEPVYQTVTTVPALGVAEYATPVPAQTVLLGAAVFGQWVNLQDARVSAALPLTLSNGVTFSLGSVLAVPGFTVSGDPTASNGATWTYVASRNGVAYDLRGRLYRPALPPAGGHALYPAVVISHGAGGNADGYSAAIARTMVSWGLVCIMTNLTHAGGVPLGAPGLATERGASAANVLRNMACVDLLQGLGYVDLRRVAAHGHSMGAFATGALLGTHGDRFLVGSHSAGGMSTQPQAAATSVAQAAAIAVPYQLHHGDADTVVPLAMDQALGNQLASNPTVHQLLVYAGFTHAQIATDPGMLTAVRAWYVQHGLLPQ